MWPKLLFFEEQQQNYTHFFSIYNFTDTLPHHTVNLGSIMQLFTFLKLRTFTFLLKGNTSQLLFGIIKLPPSLLSHFWAMY